MARGVVAGDPVRARNEQRRLCIEVDPPLEDRGAGHPNACHYAEALQVL